MVLVLGEIGFDGQFNGMQARDGKGLRRPWTMVFMSVVSTLAFLAACGCGYATEQPHPHIKYHELVTIETLHHVHRRAGEHFGEEPLIFNFFGKEYPVRIRRDRTPKNYKIIVVGDEMKERNAESDMTYTGRVEGHDNSQVRATIVDGIITMKIRIGDETIYVDRHDDHPVHTHMVYRGADVSVGGEEGNVHPSYCGHSHSSTNMQQNDSGNMWTGMFGHSSDKRRTDSTDGLDGHSHEQRIEYDHKDSYLASSTSRNRRRNTNNLICKVAVLVDYPYYNKVGSPFSEESRLNAVTDKIHSYFQEVNEIYSSTPLKNQLGYKFAVSRIYVVTSESQDELNSRSAVTQNCCTLDALLRSGCTEGSSCVNTVLGEFNKGFEFDGNTVKFKNSECLGHLFTNRVFSGGVLGLAYIGAGHDSSAIHGICGTDYNTGLSTNMQGSGQQIATAVAEIVLAHELGHNYGAKHDTDTFCSSNGGVVSGYLMAPSATDGSQGNQNKFSACSRIQMEEVLDELDQFNKQCFVASDDAICGNLITETGEDCDCGTDVNVCQKMCCTPAGEANGCQLAGTSECSTSQGNCCTYNAVSATCSFAPSDKQCSSATSGECFLDQNCTGTNASCPDFANTNAKCDCNDAGEDCTSTCSALGYCEQSICYSIGLEPCSPPAGECRAHCNSTSGVCELFEDGSGGQDMRVGTTCTTSSNENGYCNQDGDCSPYDQDPFNLLRKFWSNFNLGSIGDWIADHWWVIVLGIIGVIVIIIILRVTYTCSRVKVNDERKQVLHTLQSRETGGRPVSHGAKIKRNDSTLVRLRQRYTKASSNKPSENVQRLNSQVNGGGAGAAQEQNHARAQARALQIAQREQLELAQAIELSKRESTASTGSKHKQDAHVMKSISPQPQSAARPQSVAGKKQAQQPQTQHAAAATTTRLSQLSAQTSTGSDDMVISRAKSEEKDIDVLEHQAVAMAMRRSREDLRVQGPQAARDTQEADMVAQALALSREDF